MMQQHNQNTSSSNVKKRKPYTHLACTCCKEKHLKCDGARPSCQNCVAKKIECHYREERNRRRESASSRTQQRIEDDLRDRLWALEQEVERWKIKYFHLKELTQGHSILHHDYDEGQSHSQLQQQLHQLQLHSPQFETRDLYLRKRSQSMPVHHDHYGELQYEQDVAYGNNMRNMDVSRMVPGVRVTDSSNYGSYPIPYNSQQLEEFDQVNDAPRTSLHIHSFPDRRRSFSYGDLPDPPPHAPANLSPIHPAQPYSHHRRGTIDAGQYHSGSDTLSPPLHHSDSSMHSAGSAPSFDFTKPLDAQELAQRHFTSEAYRSNSVPAVLPLATGLSVRRRSSSQPKVQKTRTVMHSVGSAPSFDTLGGGGLGTPHTLGPGGHPTHGRMESSSRMEGRQMEVPSGHVQEGEQHEQTKYLRKRTFQQQQQQQRQVMGHSGYEGTHFSALVDSKPASHGVMHNFSSLMDAKQNIENLHNAQCTGVQLSLPYTSPAGSAPQLNGNAPNWVNRESEQGGYNHSNPSMNGTIPHGINRETEQGFDPRLFSSLVDSKPADELYAMDMEDEEDSPRFHDVYGYTGMGMMGAGGGPVPAPPIEMQEVAGGPVPVERYSVQNM